MRDAVLLAEHKTSASVDPDEALVLAARTDPDAFGALYERHRLGTRYLRTRTSTEDDAVELTSMTFERALRSIDRFRPSGGGFMAWLLRIARNAAIDWGRRHRAAVDLDLDLVDGLIENQPRTCRARERATAIE